MLWQDAIEGLRTSKDPGLTKRLLAVLHEEINLGRINDPAFAEQLDACYRDATDPRLSAEIKRLQNRSRSRRVLGGDLLKLRRPPLGDDDRIKLWEDLKSLKTVYEKAADHTDIFEEKYDVCEMIGEGGMGIVFRAVRNSDKQEVAIKYLREELFKIPATVARFRRECRLCLSFDHPNIVKVFEAGDYQGNGFMVMEYCRLGGLEAYVTHADLNAGMAVLAILQAAEALKYVHSRDVVHRDVKLSNLLVSQWQPGTAGDWEGEIQVKLTDFGLSKELSKDGFTAAGARMGTEFYAAPEMIADPSGVDHRADIYSLGVSMYRLMSGGIHPAADYKPLHIVQPAVPPELDDVFRKCIKEDREERYSSVSTFTDELEKVRKIMGGPC